MSPVTHDPSLSRQAEFCKRVITSMLSLLSAFSRRTPAGPECSGVTKQEEGVCGALASPGEVKDAILRNLDLYSGSVQPIRRVSVLARSILSHKVFNKTAV